MLEREGVLKLTESKSVTAHRDADGIKVSASALLFRVVPPVTTAAPEDEEYEKVSISRPTNEHIMFEGKTLQSVVGEMKRHRHIA